MRSRPWRPRRASSRTGAVWRGASVLAPGSRFGTPPPVAASPALALSGRRGALVEDDPELRGILVALVAGDEEILRARRVERLQQPHLLAAHGEPVRDVVG